MKNLIKNKKADDGLSYWVWILVGLALIVGISGAFRIQEGISAVPSWIWWVIAGFLLLSLLKGGKRK